jgi:hypothetical protein
LAKKLSRANAAKESIIAATSSGAPMFRVADSVLQSSASAAKTSFTESFAMPRCEARSLPAPSMNVAQKANAA